MKHLQAACAAVTAASTSAGPLSATRPITVPSAGEVTSSLSLVEGGLLAPAMKLSTFLGRAEAIPRQLLSKIQNM
jgi:hypothetical protein